jgi:hypothetical protein
MHICGGMNRGGSAKPHLNWNELESNRLSNKKIVMDFFGYKLKGNGVSLGDLICLNVDFLAISVKLL